MSHLQNLRNKKIKNAGFSLTEVVIVVTIAAFSILAIWNVYTMYIKISLSNPAFFKASFLAEEGVEAVKFMRDSNWTVNIVPLTPGTEYTLVLNAGAWSTTVTPSFIDGKFDRRIAVYDVYRDLLSDIAEAGVLDPNTKKVVVTVSWLSNTATTSRQITTYVSNIFNN